MNNVVQLNQHETPQTNSDSDDGPPCFIAWRYPNGSITVAVAGVADDVDGETLLTFTPYVGVEPGLSTVMALVGEPTIIIFEGTYDEQLAVFREWQRQAETNARPTIFRERGLKAFARLGTLDPPPLPKIDETETARQNELLNVSRELMRETAETRELTLADCKDIVGAVARAAAETDGRGDPPQAA
jgi:hypothetical protein